MGPWKSLTSFNRQERSGIFYLLLFIILLQILYYLISNLGLGSIEPEFGAGANEVRRLVLKGADSSQKKHPAVIYPFNPNFITDFKGYTFGLSIKELDRLNMFRAGNTYINSAAEFQQVTGVGDSLLEVLAPFFRFYQKGSGEALRPVNPDTRAYPTPESRVAQGRVEDLNSATAEQLMTINGIGPVLSERIIRFRNALGGFLSERQLLDVYGLDQEVAIRAIAQFKVMETPEVVTININTATVEELAANVYISYSLARAIVRYREQSGPITSMDTISGLEGFPSEKFDRISLYLSL